MQRFLLATLAVSLLGAASAMAGPLWSSPNGAEGAWQNSEPRPVAARQPNFGGGLFEFLATGGRGMRANPPPTYGAQPPSLLARGEPEPDPRRGFDPRFRRQIVDFSGGENPGTIVIGRPGFAWSGVKEVSMKREWPDWTPPDDMLRRRPDLPRYMPGGPENPLGARALYLGSSLYRIHGSNEPWTIGTAVSSGCIRMRNEDVIDLYDRVKVGTKVVVI